MHSQATEAGGCLPPRGTIFCRWGRMLCAWGAPGVTHAQPWTLPAGNRWCFLQPNQTFPVLQGAAPHWWPEGRVLGQRTAQPPWILGGRSLHPLALLEWVFLHPPQTPPSACAGPAPSAEMAPPPPPPQCTPIPWGEGTLLSAPPALSSHAQWPPSRCPGRAPLHSHVASEPILATARPAAFPEPRSGPFLSRSNMIKPSKHHPSCHPYLKQPLTPCQEQDRSIKALLGTPQKSTKPTSSGSRMESSEKDKSLGGRMDRCCGIAPERRLCGWSVPTEPLSQGQQAGRQAPLATGRASKSCPPFSRMGL